MEKKFSHGTQTDQKKLIRFIKIVFLFILLTSPINITQVSSSNTQRTVRIRFVAEWRNGYDFSRHAVIEINDVENQRWVFNHNTDKTIEITIDISRSNTIKAYTVYSSTDDRSSRYYGALYVDGVQVTNSEDAGPHNPLRFSIPQTNPTRLDFSIDLLVSDKTSYNPGETAQLWARISNTGNIKIDSADARFVVKDPNGLEVFSGTDRKSIYLDPGQVKIFLSDWNIPSNTEAGLYKIEVGITAFEGPGQSGSSVTHSAETPSAFSVKSQPAPDYTVTIDPLSQTIRQGDGTTFSVTITSLNGWNSPVTLSVSGLPSGSSGSFLTNPVTPTATSTMSITTLGSVSTGTFNFVVTGLSGTKQHTSSASITIEHSPAPNPEPTPDVGDGNNSPDKATSITIDMTTAAEINPAGDIDYYRFDASAGSKYVIETSLGTASDTYLHLYKSDGVTEIAKDDDSGEGLASKIEWTCPTSGIYYIKVRHYSPNKTGTYTLTLTLIIEKPQSLFKEIKLYQVEPHQLSNRKVIVELLVKDVDSGSYVDPNNLVVGKNYFFSINLRPSGFDDLHNFDPDYPGSIIVEYTDATGVRGNSLMFGKMKDGSWVQMDSAKDPQTRARLFFILAGFTKLSPLGTLYDIASLFLDVYYKSIIEEYSGMVANYNDNEYDYFIIPILNYKETAPVEYKTEFQFKSTGTTTVNIYLNIAYRERVSFPLGASETYYYVGPSLELYIR